MAKKKNLQLYNGTPDLTYRIILVKELKWIALALSLLVLAIKSLLSLWVS